MAAHMGEEPKKEAKHPLLWDLAMIGCCLAILGVAFYMYTHDFEYRLPVVKVVWAAGLCVAIVLGVRVSIDLVKIRRQKKGEE